MSSALLVYTQAVGGHSFLDGATDPRSAPVSCQLVTSYFAIPLRGAVSRPAVPPLQLWSPHNPSHASLKNYGCSAQPFFSCADSFGPLRGGKPAGRQVASRCEPIDCRYDGEGNQCEAASCSGSGGRQECGSEGASDAVAQRVPLGTSPVGRRNLVAGVGLMGLAATSAGAAEAHEVLANQVSEAGSLSRLNQVTSVAARALVDAPPDTTITDRVYLDFSLCPNAFRPERTLGQMSLICDDGEPLGRVVIGLYGKQVPQTVENFKAMVTGAGGSTYKGSTIHKILQGQYFQAGRQGSVDKGEVLPPKHLPRNPETIEGGSFKLGHNRPGTVSLCLGTNDDDDDRKLDAEYRNVEFLVTTGPGPAPQLDNGNIVFGTILEGMNVVSQIAAVPTNRPSDRIRQFNDLAEFLGDDRASKGRTSWNKPLKSIVIQDCGLLA